MLRRVLHAARLSVIGNKFRNKLPVTPATHLAERCNGPAMKGVDGTVRRLRGEEEGG